MHDFVLHEGGDVLQQRLVVGGELAVLGVEDTHRADGVSVHRRDRCPGVEPDVRIRGDERVLGEPRVEVRIVDHHHVVGRDDRVRAERVVPP